MLKIFALQLTNPLVLYAFLCALWVREEHRRIVGECTLLLACVLMTNPVLKAWFAVPFLPTVGKVGYAFPSGHLQLYATVYAWLMYRGCEGYVRWWAGGGLALGGAIGTAAVVHQGYHTVTDVWGAIVCSSVTLGIAHRTGLARVPLSTAYATVFAAGALLWPLAQCGGLAPRLASWSSLAWIICAIVAVYLRYTDPDARERITRAASKA